MSKINRYYNIFDNKELIRERKNLFKQYGAAIETDLPFEETKKIYLRLKEIEKQLKNEKQSASSDY